MAVLDPEKLIPHSRLNSSHTESLVGIKVKVIDAKSLLKGTLAEEKAQFKEQKRIDEKIERGEEEEGLEEPDEAKKAGIAMPPIPGQSLIQKARNFINNILLGWVLIRMLKFLPQLVGLLKPLGAFADWIVSFGGTILKGLVTLVDWGYKAYDWTRKQVGNVFGERGVKTFDKVSGVLKNVLNLTLGLTLAMIALSNEFGSNLVEWGKGFMSIFKHGLKRAVPRLLIKMFGKKTAASLLGKSVVAKTVAATTATTATTAAAKVGGMAVGAKVAIVGSAGLLSSGLGEGAFQIKKWGQKHEDKAFENYKSKSWVNPMKYFDWGALQVAKFFNYVVGGVGVLLDIIGAPFRYLVELVRYPFLDEVGKRKQRQNLAKFDARIREQFREIVNAFSLGLLAKDKGSFGSLYGSEGTDAMGYTQPKSIQINDKGKSTINTSGLERSASYDKLAGPGTIVTPQWYNDLVNDRGSVGAAGGKSSGSVGNVTLSGTSPDDFNLDSFQAHAYKKGG